MGFKRRTFLQQTGLVLLTLIGENGLFSPKLKGYLQALSEPTPRKLALLVGINNYSQTKNLSGCLTDVELQRELLINRFGFNPSDIITLTDQQATRENIEAAFVEHLLAQAKVTDVVVFHFSGYGSLVKKPQSSDKPIASLVSAKGILSGETLELLARSLDTEKLTMILDTSYKSTGALLKGNWRVRSFPDVLEEFPPEELAFQLQLNSQNGSPIPGIILSAAKENQIATEAVWNGFSAGLFTYALTQYLWQVTPASTVQKWLNLLWVNSNSPSLLAKAIAPCLLIICFQIDK
jgi:Caspase domain